MKKVKQLLLIVSLACSWQSTAYAQEDVGPEMLNNSVYFELLGNAYFYSLNYERNILNTPKFTLSGRVGASLLSFSVIGAGLSSDFNLVFFPLTLNMLRHFNRNKLEVGMGLANEFSTDDTDAYGYVFIPTLHVGYRRTTKNDFDFRVGVNLSRAELDQDDHYEIFPWPFISFGKRF